MQRYGEDIEDHQEQRMQVLMLVYALLITVSEVGIFNICISYDPLLMQQFNGFTLKNSSLTSYTR
jgi:hypothetical protein